MKTKLEFSREHSEIKTEAELDLAYAEYVASFSSATTEEEVPAVSGVLHIGNISDVRPSDIGGWFPAGPITPQQPEWISFKNAKKRGSDEPNRQIRYRLGDKHTGKVYLSLLLGLFNDARTKGFVSGELVDSQGNLRNDFLLGFEKTENKQYPLQMVLKSR